MLPLLLVALFAVLRFCAGLSLVWLSLVLPVVCFLGLMWLVNRAPEGYQDSRGFHLGRRTLPVLVLLVALFAARPMRAKSPLFGPIVRPPVRVSITLAWDEDSDPRITFFALCEVVLDEAGNVTGVGDIDATVAAPATTLDYGPPPAEPTAVALFAVAVDAYGAQQWSGPSNVVTIS